jgi:acetoin utilization deacetylase AcuC-like enzyme
MRNVEGLSIQICRPKLVMGGTRYTQTQEILARWGDNVQMTWSFRDISIVHVYMRSESIVKLHTKRPRMVDITKVRCDSYLHCVQRDSRLAEEKRLPAAKNVRRYFNWHKLRRRTKRMITCLLTSAGITLTTCRDIRNNITAFYASANAGRQQR